METVGFIVMRLPSRWVCKSLLEKSEYLKPLLGYFPNILYASLGHNLWNFRRAMGIERKARKRVIASPIPSLSNAAIGGQGRQKSAN